MAELWYAEPELMPDVVTQSFVYELINQLRDHIDSRHISARAHTDARFDLLENKLDSHAKEDLVIANKVLVIETARDIERDLASKHGRVAGAWAALGVSSAITVLGWVIQWLRNP